MKIKRLVLANFRNIPALEIQADPKLNWITGLNGSGKTSLLEAIYFLARGRSFRASKSSTLIQHQNEKLECYGEFVCIKEGGFTLGVQKKQLGGAKYRVNGEACSKLSDFVKHAVVSIIAPDSVRLVNGTSDVRRQLIDWAVFHVEHCSIVESQRYARALKQRNMALKQQAPPKDREIWDNEIITLGEQINARRKTYYSQIKATFMQYMEALYPDWQVEMTWNPGWCEDLSLAEALHQAAFKDKALGYTTVGPHRADFSLIINGEPATDVLSRGQTKLITMLLTVAQLAVQSEHTKKRGILLVDDLEAELDQKNITTIFEFLLVQGHQLFITCLDDAPKYEQLFAGVSSHRVFHVEHGLIEQHPCGQIH